MTAQHSLAYRRLYKHHSGHVGYWEGWVEGTVNDAKVVMQYAKRMDGKATRREFPATPKNIGRSNETTSLEQAQLELDSRSRKQQDKGYTVNYDDALVPSTNALGLVRPMKGYTVAEVGADKIDWSTAYAQPKLDGHRVLNKGELYSSGGKPVKLPHVREAIREVGLEGLHLDGEMYCHGYTLQEIASLVKRPREESLNLSFHLFDTVGEEPWTERFAKLGYSKTPDHWPDALKIVPSIKVGSYEQLLELHEQFVAEGYEGTMLRWGTEGYMGGKKVKHLLKLKDFLDAEFKIVGVERGVPYATSKGIFEVPVWVCAGANNDKTFTVVAQGNMHEKHALWETREDHLDKQLTLKYHYLIDGIPQLPVALRFREDI